MRPIKRALLWIITVAIPVTIAACYGVAYRFSKLGHVRDSATGSPIEGIEVNCVDAGGSDASMTWSGADGSFEINYDEPCASLRAEDTDGADNGTYASATVPFDESSDDILIDMDPQ